MESPKSVASTLNGAHLNGAKRSTMLSDSDKFMGLLEVFVHQARDIHNICIYHKQDVYAKLCLTNDPDRSFSTKIINGGGRNPVFDDTLMFDVKNVECSLKCEIYMMSRVKNYLEDQLLGFTLVPLSEVILRNGKLKKEFSLSSTDLFHSPAGFLELSLSYTGDSPEVMSIPVMETVDEISICGHLNQVSIEFDEIEFLDPKIVCENNQMVSKYLGSPCSDIVDSDEFVSSETGFAEVNSIQSAAVEAALPTSTVSTNGISSPSVSSDSSDTNGDCKLSKGQDGKTKDNNNGELDKTDEAALKPVLTVNTEPEQKVVQQDIVDIYTKSLQQFTESLAKMKLPLDIESPTQSENSSSSQTPKSASSRVFYGSRAFF